MPLINQLMPWSNCKMLLVDRKMKRDANKYKNRPPIPIGCTPDLVVLSPSLVPEPRYLELLGPCSVRKVLKHRSLEHRELCITWLLLVKLEYWSYCFPRNFRRGIGLSDFILLVENGFRISKKISKGYAGRFCKVEVFQSASGNRSEECMELLQITVSRSSKMSWLTSQTLNPFKCVVSAIARGHPKTEARESRYGSRACVF